MPNNDSKIRESQNLFESSLFNLSPTEVTLPEEKLSLSPPFRNLFCPYYSTCLLFVVLQHPTWISFSCSSCEHRTNDSGKLDIEPSEILRTNYFIKTTIKSAIMAQFNKFSEFKTITQGSDKQPITYINKTKLPGRKP